jgi:WD40 repeat protein
MDDKTSRRSGDNEKILKIFLNTRYATMVQTNTLVKAQKITSFKRSLAVVIGINEYQNNIPKLQTARRDAEALAQILAKEHQYDEVILITDATEFKPTRKNLLTLLKERLPKEIQPTKDDRLLFYFAGHGIARDSDKGPAGCLVPLDADLEKNENLLSMQEFHDCLNALSCRHLLVILDCCFAGTFRWSTARLATVVPTVIRKEHYDRFIKSPAWQAITSAAHNQEALDILRDNRGGDRHSPFALALFKALRGEGDVIPAAKNGKSAGDGVISATELYLYLRDRVETASNESQTPGIWTLSKHDRGEYIFLVPGADPKLKPAPKLTEKNNPYRGLQSFEEEHSQLFFGRKELVKELYEKISHASSSLTVVLGISGSGKSSLVKAGLIPYLRQNHAQKWYILKPMRPSESPFTALARTILLITNNIFVSNHLDNLHFIHEILQKEITELNQRIDECDENSEEDELLRLEQKVKTYERIADLWQRGTQEAKQLLIVDRFDEINSLCRDPHERTILKETVLDCLNPLGKRLRDPDEFIKIVKTWSEQRPRISLLLIIDQFEELITLSSQHEENQENKQTNLTESQQFLKVLEAILAERLPQLSIVVTLRSDFEPRFLNSEELKSYWTHARFPVRAMRSDELRQAIERPAAEMALYFEQLPGEQNPVDKLVDEVGQMPGALPLLSFTLSELYIKLAKKWEALETSDRALTLDAEFDKEGGVAGSLTRRANQEYDSLPDDRQRDTMRRVMLRMVTVEGGESARRRVPLSELVYADKHEPNKPDNEENQRVKLVLKLLNEARLIVSGQETGEPYVEPAHDFLVRSWDKLQQWQQQEQEDLPLQRRLTPAALEWKNKEQSASVLGKAEPVLSWFDKKIDFAEDWFNEIKKNTRERQQEKKRQFLWNGNPYLDVLRKKLKSVDYWFNQVEAEFVQQSFWQRRRNVNLRWTIAIGVILGLSWLTFWALREQRTAVINQMSADKNSTETDLRSNQLTLDAFIKSLRAAKSSKHWLLQAFQPDEQLQNQVIGTLRKAFYTVREHSRWQLPQSVVVQDVFVSQDSKLLVATTAEDGTVCIRNLPSQQCDELLRNQDSVKSAQFSSDGMRLVITDSKDTIHLWNLESKQFEELPRLQDSVTKVIFSPDGKRAILNNMYLWDLENKQLYTLSRNQGHNIIGVSFSFDNNLLVATTAEDRTTVNLWNYSSGRNLGSINARHSVDDTIISPNGKQMIIHYGSARNVGVGVLLWNVQSNFLQSLGKDITISFSPNGEQLATSGEDGIIHLRDSFGDSITEFKGSPGWVSLRFSADSKQLLSVGSDATIRLWNMQSKQLNQFQKLPGSVSSLSFSPDGKQLATLEEGTIRLWDFSGKQLATLPEKYNPESNLIFRPKSNQLAIIEPSAIRLWDLSLGKEVNTLSGDYSSGYSFSFSPDGMQLAILETNDTLRVLDLSNKQVQEVKSDTFLFASVIWSQDGKLLVATKGEFGPGTQTVNLFDLSSRKLSSSKQLASLLIGQNYVREGTGVNLNHDGSLVAIANEGSVSLWDLQDRQIVEFQAHSGDVKSLSISPDGSTLAVVGKDGTAKLWQIGGFDELLTRGCEQVRDYLATLDEKNSDRHLCDSVIVNSRP